MQPILDHGAIVETIQHAARLVFFVSHFRGVSAQMVTFLMASGQNWITTLVGITVQPTLIIHLMSKMIVSKMSITGPAHVAFVF